jgi:quercetin dioxygenase-like cupin family protein
VTTLRIDATVIPGGEPEIIRYPDDEIRLLAVGRGDVQVVEYSSMDRAGSPPHSHPWDEVEIVVEGRAEFLVGQTWTAGGPGTVQLLPRGVGHSTRIPEGTARIMMITIGAPYDRFAREMATLFEAGAALPEIAEAAARHGVTLVPPDPEVAVD